MSHPKVIVDFLNVGFGEAIFIHTGDYTVLVDGGDNRESIYKRSNRKKAIEYVKEKKISHIHLLVITHFHRDHIAGILDIVLNVSVDEVWVMYQFDSNKLNYSLPTDPALGILDAINIYKRIQHVLENNGTKIYQVNNTMVTSLGDLKIHVLQPDRRAQYSIQTKMNRLHQLSTSSKMFSDLLTEIDQHLNAASLVLLFQWKRRNFLLLSGEVPVDYWYDFLNQHIQADIIKAPHHGDVNCLSREFLHMTNPKHVVISADNEGTFDLPSPQVSNFIHQFNPQIQIHFTHNPSCYPSDEDGVVRFVIQ